MEKLASTVDVYDDLMRDVDTLRRFNIAAGTYMDIHVCTPSILLRQTIRVNMYESHNACT